VTHIEAIYKDTSISNHDVYVGIIAILMVHIKSTVYTTKPTVQRGALRWWIPIQDQI